MIGEINHICELRWSGKWILIWLRELSPNYLGGRKKKLKRSLLGTFILLSFAYFLSLFHPLWKNKLYWFDWWTEQVDWIIIPGLAFGNIRGFVRDVLTTVKCLLTFNQQLQFSMQHFSSTVREITRKGWGILRRSFDSSH